MSGKLAVKAANEPRRSRVTSVTHTESLAAEIVRLVSREQVAWATTSREEWRPFGVPALTTRGSQSRRELSGSENRRWCAKAASGVDEGLAPKWETASERRGRHERDCGGEAARPGKTRVGVRRRRCPIGRGSHAAFTRGVVVAASDRTIEPASVARAAGVGRSRPTTPGTEMLERHAPQKEERNSEPFVEGRKRPGGDAVAEQKWAGRREASARRRALRGFGLGAAPVTS